MDKSNLNRLLSSTQILLRHQKEIEILRGETFNVFSVLRMESSENDTHSAFLVELLNPKGSHLKGSVFLELFLKTIGYQVKNNGNFDLSTATAQKEKHIGPRDDLKKTGGRVDIFIKDKQKNCISIENKIYAGDQSTQIERYCNFLKETNTVYYLSLYGSEATTESKGKLEAGKDYFTISYKEQILQWLQLCIKETTDSPILRETIKQYIILIKKLSQTMDTNEEKELFDIILRHQEESAVISANYNKAILSVYDELRNAIFEKLKTKISNNYNVLLGSKVHAQISQIWIKIKGKNETKIFFGIQGFSIANGFRIGIYVYNGLYLPEYEKLGHKESNWWIGETHFDDFKGFSSNINDPKTIYKLFSDADFQIGFVNHIVNETIQYLDDNYEAVNSLLSN